MKLAVATVAYNEEALIAAVIRNWRGKVHKHVVFLSSKPWHGVALPPDKTEEIALREGAEVVSLPWPSETAQRNWALAYLYQYDYVLVVDADELFTDADTHKIIDTLGTNAGQWRVDNTNCYRIKNIRTYFKTPDYILDPPDTHLPSIAVNPKKVTYREHRIPSQTYELIVPGVTMHHLSYLRDDQRLYHKLQQFEHHDDVKPEWFTETWKHWTPDREDVRAYGHETSKAVYSPMPQEIRDLL